MESRAFNSISVDIHKRVLTKASANTLKLKDEINYYRKLPNNILCLFPRLLEFEENYKSYSIEYIPYKSLAELILKKLINITEAKTILKKLFDILDEIHATKLIKPDIKKISKNFLIQKTIDRISLLKNNPLFSDLINSLSITINGKTYKTFKYYQEQFIVVLENFFNANSLSTIIHGDFSLSNILYCANSKNIKLIDPRGSFGIEGIYGHPYYDYAKLMHCIDGSYDYIVNGHFTLVQESNTNYKFHIENSPLLSRLYLYFKSLLIKRNFDIEILQLIESSLFLSMTPLHYEDSTRQKALFLNGLILMNNFFERI